MSALVALPGTAASPVRPMLERVLVAIEAFWIANLVLTKYAVGVTQQVMRLQDRCDVLWGRLSAGTLSWRARAPRVGRTVARAVPVAPDGTAAEVQRAAPARKPGYVVPRYYGWLADLMPNSAPMLATDLEAVFKTAKMRTLMLATPEVARRARPLFRMLRADETLLLVPEGYSGATGAQKRRHHAPDPGPVDRMVDDMPLVIVPEDYDERRDGRKPHPLRSPDWNYRAFENYRSYLYYFMNRRPKWMRG